MKGTVLPSSNNCMAAETCSGFTVSSPAIIWLI
jgi:hypothetical protein